jgi:hypothetical protein
LGNLVLLCKTKAFLCCDFRQPFVKRLLGKETFCFAKGDFS